MHCLATLFPKSLEESAGSHVFLAQSVDLLAGQHVYAYVEVLLQSFPSCSWQAFSSHSGFLSGFEWSVYGHFVLDSTWTKDFDFSAINLADITERPWFKRGWTFQEAVLASDVTVMCGSSTLTWDTLIRGLSKVFRSNYIEDYGWIFEFSNDEAIQTLAGLINIWMHLERPTTWNKIRMRRKLRGKTTMDGYQLRGQDSLTNLTCLMGFSLLRLPFFVYRLVIYFAKHSPLYYYHWDRPSFFQDHMAPKYWMYPLVELFTI